MWKVSTTEKTIFFFLSLYLQWQRFLSIFRSEVSVGFLTCAFLLQGWEITLLFRARHFALGTDLEISTFHFRFPPKDLKVFWSVNTQILFELYSSELEYLCLLKETRHGLITVITDANNILRCQRLSHGILDLQGTFKESSIFLRGCDYHAAPHFQVWKCEAQAE